MPWVLLAVGVVLALMTVPALYTVHHWTLLFPAFALSWLGTGMAGCWLVLVPSITVVLVALGGLAAWPGWVGLVLVVLAMGGLVRQALEARAGADEFDRVLAARVADRVRTRRAPRSRVLPWSMRDATVERIKNIRYADGAGRRHLLDVYRPATRCQDAPVVLQIHGGGWSIGTKDTQGRPLMNRLARAGWICVAANYQLSPRVRWPEHLVDAKRALAWVREHIAEYGGDPARVVVTGGSAGGHLTAMLALTVGDARFQPGFEHVDTSVSGAIPMYGAYDLAEIFGRFDRGLAGRIAGRMGKVVVGTTPDEDRAPYVDASPIAHVDAKACPFLVVHGTIDNLVPVAQARRFVTKLRDVGTDVTYVELAGAPHAFDVFHSTWEHASTTGIEWWLGSVAGLAPSPLVGTASGASSGVDRPGRSTPAPAVTTAAPARSEAAVPAATDPTTTVRTAPS
jgi:acetyl esterase/lipase